MRMENLVVSAMILVAGTGCSGGSGGTVTGMRADGVKVDCTTQSDDVSTCVPADPGQCESGATVLWPPNHKLISFTLADCMPVQTTCGGSGSGSGSGVILLAATSADATGGTHITSITADEAVEVGAGGDGHTIKDDIQIVDAVSFALRSERQGNGDGRVYRVNFVDDAGAEGSCEFQVPHDQGPARGAVDSGTVVTVKP